MNEIPKPPASQAQTSSWQVRISAEAAGIVTVNGIPAAGSYSGSGADPTSPTPGLVDSGWIDIRDLLSAQKNNVISVAIWNRYDHYAWDVQLRHGEEILWHNEQSGNGQSGEVFFKTFIIDGDGKIVSE